MKKGQIIFLNGVSSTGKSSLSRKLQERLSEPYHWLNVDEFISFTDMRKHPSTYFEKGKDPVSLFPHVVKLYSDMGVNVIADVAFMKWIGPRMFMAEETFTNCVEMLSDYPIMYVHVTCPYKEVRRRHEERGNRGEELGLDYGDETLVGDTDGIYDLVVNTHSETLDECADRIIKKLASESEFNAFRKIKASKVQSS